MRKIVLTCLLAGLYWSAVAQRHSGNKLIEADFWKGQPNVEQVKAALAEGVSIHDRAPNNNDALSIAILNDAPEETIKYLIDLSVGHIDTTTHDGRSYLVWASMRGKTNIIKYLVSKNANVNFKDSHGTTPLSALASSGNTDFELFDFLIKKGADVKVKNSSGASLILMAAQKDKDAVLTKYLIKKGLSIKDVDADGNNAFYYAARSGNINMIEYYLKNKLSYNSSALIAAASGGGRGAANGLEVFEFITNLKGIDVNVKDSKGGNVINLLSKKPKQLETIKYFENKGVALDIVDADGNTAFLNAVGSGDMAMAQYLFSSVKDINHKNGLGNSALTLAVKGNSPEMLAFVLGKGADVNVEDKNGDNINYYLISSFRPRNKADFDKKISILNQFNFDLSKTSSNGNSILHYTASTGNFDLIKTMLTVANKNINLQNEEGMTPLHKAALVAKDIKILDLLLKNGADKTAKTGFDETAYDIASENEHLIKNKVDLTFLK